MLLLKLVSKGRPTGNKQLRLARKWNELYHTSSASRNNLCFLPKKKLAIWQTT